MAPKKRPAKVVKSRKVVEETVEVVVTPPEGEEADERLELVSASTKERENVEIFSPSPRKASLIKKVTVQEKEKDKDQDLGDDDETQPNSEPDITLTPPLKAPPPKTVGGKPPEVLPRKQEKVEGKRKSSGADDAAGKRRRKRARAAGEGYRTYVYKVMKQVHPDMGISSNAMTIINNLMSDMFEKVAVEAGRLSDYSGRKTLSSREILAAVKLVLPGELGKHAITEGNKAIKNYVSSVSSHDSHRKNKP